MDQVYYDSFEFLPQYVDVLKTSKAKSGEYVALSHFYVDLDNHAKGKYIITFWISQDDGETWTQYTDYIELTDDNPSDTYFFSMDNYYDWIDEVRVMPVNATMKTYSYKTGYGKTSETDINGHSMFKIYDSKGRISKTTNNKHEVLTEFEYNIVAGTNN